MLEKLRGRTLVVNDPRGLREANEKLYTLHFARHMPRTLVTTDRDRIHRFVAEVGTGVVKPLDGAGGSGVMVVDKGDRNAGGRVEPCEVTPAERAIVADMAPRLATDGLVFVGLDFIGGRLTEVNVTSPTGIQELSRHRGKDVAEDVIAWIERHVGEYRPMLNSIPPI